MSRYIDSEKIEIRTPYGLNDDGELLIPISAVHQSIARTPTADVVEVVRCKDCKKYSDFDNKNCKRLTFHFCTRFDNIMKEDDFCSYGERKEKMKIINCPNCGTEMISESVGWKCPDCKGFISMDGVFHEYKETRFMPPKTNYDVITSKSVERLAEFLIWICHEPIFSDFTKEDWIEELSKEVD